MGIILSAHPAASSSEPLGAAGLILPNARFLELRRCQRSPISICRRASWTWMQNPAHPQLFAFKDMFRAFRREVADADQPLWLENFHNVAQMLIARSKQRFSLRRRQFIGGAIATRALQKSHRTIVRHKVVPEKVPGISESRGEQSPQPLAADLAARAIEPGYASLRMLVRWTTDFGANPQPVSHCSDLSERHPGLRHSKRTRIHAEKQDAFAATTVTSQIRLVPGPGVIERIVNMRDRLGETKLADSLA